MKSNIKLQQELTKVKDEFNESNAELQRMSRVLDDVEELNKTLSVKLNQANNKINMLVSAHKSVVSTL